MSRRKEESEEEKKKVKKENRSLFCNTQTNYKLDSYSNVDFVLYFKIAA
eukprot:SAG11_NODE_43916_length_160_cov_80.393443_1_plen_48_part_10